MQTITIDSVKIRENRQRKDLGDLTDLKASLVNVGLINPIVIEQDSEDTCFYLIAGERRYTAWKELYAEGKVSNLIPCRVLSSLSPSDKHLIELEENIKRKDLTWQEYCEAVDKMYELKGCQTNEELAEYLGMKTSVVQRARFIWANRDNPKVLAADNISNALTICKRESARVLDSAKNELDFILATSLYPNLESEKIDEQKETKPYAGTATISGQSNGDVLGRIPETHSEPEPATARIINADFSEWARTYSGKKFNLLHLDFPYGINHDRSGQGHTKDFGTYADSEDVFKSLVQTLLENEERIISSSAHIICWISLRYFEWTKAEFAKKGFSCLMQPFIWHKSDNKGIIADTQCGMRNVGEYALIFNRGRYPVLKNISNIFPHPTTKRFHASEKPIPVLERLFEAFVDEKTRLLDPTCGSGTAIIAGAKAGAEECLGIELDEDFAKKAQEWLKIELESIKGKNEVDLSDLQLF